MTPSPACPSTLRRLTWRLGVLALLLPVPGGFAQRETFESSDYHTESAISSALSKDPAKPMVRNGAAPDGKPMTVTATDVSVSFRNVYFKLDSTELRDKASMAQVSAMASALKKGKLQSRRFLIEGHTCDLGETDYNLQLSARRAEAIRRKLVAAGVAPVRLAVLGLGESEPALRTTLPGHSPLLEMLRPANRRVVLRLLPEVPVTPDRNP